MADLSAKSAPHSVRAGALCLESPQGKESFLLKHHEFWESPGQGTQQGYNGYGHVDLGWEAFQLVHHMCMLGSGHLCRPGVRGNDIISLWLHGPTLDPTLWSL